MRLPDRPQRNSKQIQVHKSLIVHLLVTSLHEKKSLQWRVLRFNRFRQWFHHNTRQRHQTFTNTTSIICYLTMHLQHLPILKLLTIQEPLIFHLQLHIHIKSLHFRHRHITVATVHSINHIKVSSHHHHRLHNTLSNCPRTPISNILIHCTHLILWLMVQCRTKGQPQYPKTILLLVHNKHHHLRHHLVGNNHYHLDHHHRRHMVVYLLHPSYLKRLIPRIYRR